MTPTVIVLLVLATVLVAAIVWVLWKLGALLDARAFHDRGEGLLTSLEVSRRTPRDPNPPTND